MAEEFEENKNFWKEFNHLRSDTDRREDAMIIASQLTIYKFSLNRKAHFTCVAISGCA